MTGTFLHQVLAGLFLLAGHFGLSSTGLRQHLIDRIGEPAYRGLFSLMALTGLTWLTLAYRDAPYQPLWWPEPWQQFVPLVVMPLALFLLVGGVSMPNPTSVGQETALHSDRVRGVLRITRNPVMWAIGLWGLAHIVPNGDLGALLFFGPLITLALAGSVLIERKAARRHGAAWLGFTAVTSNLPFLAMVQGRQDFGRALAETGALRLVVVVVLYAALLHGHAWLIGVSALPRV